MECITDPALYLKNNVEKPVKCQTPTIINLNDIMLHVLLKWSQKHAYIILTPLNPTYI